MSNAFGPLHWLGMKPQSVAGTAETTVTNFLPTENVQMAANTGLIPRRSYLAGAGVRLPQRAGWQMPAGMCSCEAHYALPHPWYYILGDNTTTNPDTGVYLHTIEEAATGKLLTIEADMVYGDKKQADAYLSKLAFTAKVNELAAMELEWVALDHDDSPTLTSTPAATTDLIECTTVDIEIDDTQDFTIEGVTINIDRLLEQLPVLTDASGGQPQVIRKTGILDVTGSLDFIDFPTAELTKMVAATTFKLEVEITGALISGSYYKYLKITLPSCQYTGGLDTEAADTMITGTADFQASYDTSGAYMIKVECQNAVATITG